MDYSAIIDRLENEIRQYRVEYQRFFVGDAKTPPEEEWAAIHKQINRLRSVSQLTPVDRFRLGGLEGRYNSLSELFRRRLREMDHVHHATPASPPPSTGTSASAILAEGTGTEAVAGLYEALYADGQSKVALKDFHAYLETKAAKVRDKTGCSRVRFTVRSDGGKRRLKARPMPSEE